MGAGRGFVLAAGDSEACRTLARPAALPAELEKRVQEFVRQIEDFNL